MSKDLIDRAEVLELLFPLGIPPAWKPDDWDYCVSARAIYNAIMKCTVIEREETPSTSIDSVGFSHVAYRAFRKAEITTVEEVLAMSRKQLLSLYQIGPKTADDIIAALEKQGYDCERLKR
jgi:DNA-directed RNA polymerase alpha subunit